VDACCDSAEQRRAHCAAARRGAGCDPLHRWCVVRHVSGVYETAVASPGLVSGYRLVYICNVEMCNVLSRFLGVAGLVYVYKHRQLAKKGDYEALDMKPDARRCGCMRACGSSVRVPECLRPCLLVAVDACVRACKRVPVRACLCACVHLRARSSSALQ
jgi:hypothetical protein